MNLRSKTFIIVSITFIGLVIILYLISETILLSSFVELEERGVRQNVERARAALLDELVELNSTAGDWAGWDDTYTFVENPTEEYIQNNLADTTLANLRLNLMLFFNTADQLVFGTAFDLQSWAETDVSLTLQNHLADNNLLLRHPHPTSSITGLVTLPNEDPLLIASHPILTSEDQGPIHGTFLIGRYITAAQVEALAEKTKLNISIHHVDALPGPIQSQIEQTALSEAGPIFVQPVNEEMIAGYTLLKDVYGQPGFVLKIETRRDIYKQGQTTFRYFIAVLLGSGLLFGLMIMLLLEKGMVSRLTYLNQRVKVIAVNTDLAARVSITGRDEIATLAGAINTMLTALQQSEEALRQAYQELEMRVEERTVELSASNKLLKIEIEERKRVEQALAEARDQALAASHLKTELLAKVSHELRTPLSVVLGYAELLQLGLDGPLSHEQDRAITEIIESAVYLTRRVGELLDQAQLDAGKLKLNITTFKPAGLVSNTLAQMNILAQKKSLSLSYDIAPDLPIDLSGDPDRIRQILVNLVNNAIKFTKTGSVQVCLYRPDSDHWTIKVADTGVGIPAEAQGYIFEPFQQVDGSITREHRGAGLGLSIVKQLTTLMGGQVTLESQAGQGSTFTILLPLKPI